jgi:hypothetical protein
LIHRECFGPTAVGIRHRWDHLSPRIAFRLRSDPGQRFRIT